MGMDALADRVDLARRAMRAGRWREALDAVSDEDVAVSPELLEVRAEAAYGAGDFEGCVGSWEDLHSLHVDGGDRAEAGRAAAMIAMYLMIDTGLMAPVRGWLRCADRHVEDLGDHPVHAIISMVRAYERFMCGDMPSARLEAERSIELGERFRVTPAVVIGRTCTARILIFDGQMELGLGLLEEVGALLMSGAADPLTTGMMYCEIVCAAQGLLMPDLAAQWTDVMERWRHGAAFGGIHGRCRVHRAELLRLSGTCEAAEAEALAACAELRPWMRREFGWPLVELGNVRLRIGDLDGAEDAFQQAIEHAWSPHPGLALVHLAKGDGELAASMIADAIAHPIDIPSKERPPFGPLRLAPLLDAQAEIAAARGDRDTLAQASAALESIAVQYPTTMLNALSLLASSRLLLIDGKSDEAVARASRAVFELNGLGAPFDAAMARLVVAEGYDSGGHPEQAAFERRVARDALASFGAEVWAERVDRLSRPPLVSDRLAERSDIPESSGTVPPVSQAYFRCDGDTRTIGLDASTVVVRDLKGLRYIARLIAEPGRELHATQLVRLESGVDPQAVVNPGIPLLDEASKAAYRRRLADIDEDIDDALAANDLGRAELAERDREFLVAELQRATGLAGRDREQLGDGERARVSASRSIRYALDRLAEVSPAVAAHLRQHVRTGAFCSYQPDPLRPLDWLL
jgi:tetratricopeptide (TPR) repeat protein